jgi:hypothetical protein
MNYSFRFLIIEIKLYNKFYNFMISYINLRWEVAVLRGPRKHR